MNSLTPLELPAHPLIQDAALDNVFPVITRKDKNKRRVLVSRSTSVNVTSRQHVQPPGHEYDFRRTPELGRATPRRGFHGQIRPCIPPDTRTTDLEELRLTMDELAPTPVTYRTRLVEKLDVARCPTPRPCEENRSNGGHQYTNMDSARSAWAPGTNNFTTSTADGGDLSRDQQPRFSSNSRPLSRHRRTIPNPNKHVVFADVDSERVTPAPSIPLDLTEGVLNYYYQVPVDKDKRILRWIADCEEKSQALLPSHLPHIATKTSPIVSFEEL